MVPRSNIRSVMNILLLIHYAAKENKVDILEEIRNAGHSFIDDIGGSWYTVWTPLELAFKLGIL